MGERIGMLEIKLCSPFDNRETADGFLTWAHDIESRLWWTWDSVPFAYVVQLSQQALAGWSYYRMNSDDMMWLIRWAPSGFRLFRLRFYYLFKLGVWAARYYRWMLRRVKRGAAKDETVWAENAWLGERVEEAYREVRDHHESEYVSLEGWYPEFELYRQVTRLFKWRMPKSESS